MTDTTTASSEPGQPLGLALTDQLGPLPPEHAALCKAVNDDATLQSLLYDLNLLPEQTQRDPLRWGYTVAVVAHFDVAVTAERERCAAHVQENAEHTRGPLRSILLANADEIRRGPNAALTGRR